MFNIFITDPGEEAKCTFIQFMGDAKPERPDGVLESRAATQRALDRQEAYANEDYLKCVQDKG